MSVPEDKNRDIPVENTHVPKEGQPPADSGADTAHTSYEQTTDHDYDSHYHSDASYHDDPYSGQSYGAEPAAVETTTALAPVAASTGGGGDSKPPASEEEEDEEDDGMLRMSFLEHLEELRKRIISALMGLGIAFAVSLIFANEMWKAVSEPAANALKALGFPRI